MFNRDYTTDIWFREKHDLGLFVVTEDYNLIRNCSQEFIRRCVAGLMTSYGLDLLSYTNFWLADSGPVSEQRNEIIRKAELNAVQLMQAITPLAQHAKQSVGKASSSEFLNLDEVWNSCASQLISALRKDMDGLVEPMIIDEVIGELENCLSNACV